MCRWTVPVLGGGSQEGYRAGRQQPPCRCPRRRTRRDSLRNAGGYGAPGEGVPEPRAAGAPSARREQRQRVEGQCGSGRPEGDGIRNPNIRILASGTHEGVRHTRRTAGHREIHQEGESGQRVREPGRDGQDCREGQHEAGRRRKGPRGHFRRLSPA